MRRAFQDALGEIAELGEAPGKVTMPHMRFLHYSEVGGGLPPHVDLARTDELGRRSTHTFILYLWDSTVQMGEMAMDLFRSKTVPAYRLCFIFENVVCRMKT